MTGIFRQPSKQDLVRVDEDGVRGFRDLGGFIAYDEESEKNKTRTLSRKFGNTNRQIILDSKTPLSELKKISCLKCFEVEAQKLDILDENESDLFRRYQDRLNLAIINHFSRINKVGHTEEALTINLRCNNCSRGIGLSFQKQEFEGIQNLDGWSELLKESITQSQVKRGNLIELEDGKEKE